MKNKKLVITLASIGAVLLILIISVISTNNNLINKEEAVKTAQSNISINLKRRADLIPNFVKTVRNYSDYEKSAYTEIAEARSAILKSNDVKEQAAASAQLDSAFEVWVNAVTEDYPDFKASEQYRALQDELAGTEGRIKQARTDYNEAVNSYNKAVRRFPSNIVAGMFGFEKMEYIEFNEAFEVPDVNG